MNACKHPYYAERYQHTKRRLGRQRGPKVAQIDLARKLTEAMYTSLLRDEPVVPIVHRLLGDFYDYLRAIQDLLMTGRRLRGRAARRTHAAVGHALAFPTWRSLTREQGLTDREAVALMRALVDAA